MFCYVKINILVEMTCLRNLQSLISIIYSTWLKIKGYLAHFEIWCFSKCAVVTVPHFWKSSQPPFIGILETHGSSTKKICMYDEPAAYLHLYFMIWFGWYHRHYSSFVYYSIIFCFYVWLGMWFYNFFCL